MLAKSAIEQAGLVRTRAISAESLARAYLGRIEARNAKVGAFVSVAERSAIKAARAIDAERSPSSPSPLRGVPIGIKDLNFVRGMPMRGGSRSLRYFFWAPMDDSVVRRVRRAGMVILGKLATSELGILPFVETDIHPPARNPHALGHTAGGSSGGSGAAMGAGLLPLAHGSDAGGSIRIPASFCGVIGFKPSRGIAASAHRRIDVGGLVVEGPLARTVGDAAAFLDALLLQPRAMGDRMLDHAGRAPPRLTIRFATSSPDVAFSPDAREQVLRAARALEALGHRVEEGALDSGDVDEFLPLMQFMVRGAPMPFPSKLMPLSRWMRERGAQHRREGVVETAARLGARVDTWFGSTDAWLLPTVAVPPPRVGAFAALPPYEMFHAAADLGKLTAPFNVAGMPAVSLPAGVTAEGLPVGVQLAMGRGRDATLLSLAHELEASGFLRPPPAPKL